MLSHIRGSCPRSEPFRNSAYHTISTQIANFVKKKKGFEVHKEVHCSEYTEDNSYQNRRADIVILDRTKIKAMILDPKLRWKTNEDNQDKLVNEKKKFIYKPTIPFFKEKYHINNWEVHGPLCRPLLREFFKKKYIRIKKTERNVLSYYAKNT